jgi:hypothetical protein
LFPKNNKLKEDKKKEITDSFDEGDCGVYR